MEAIESFEGIGHGQGGHWEDRGYQWYAGIWPAAGVTCLSGAPGGVL
jgi:hypothetical protein